MTQYQLKNFLVDMKYDYLYTNLITAERQEVIVTLTDFIRICHEEFSQKSTGTKSKVVRDLTVNGYPIILYTGIKDYLPKLVNFLDLLKNQLELITEGKRLTYSEIHDAINYELPNVISGFKKEFGYLVSMMYECFLMNTVLMNTRALKMPPESYKAYAYVFKDKVVQPVKFIPKFGPEITCLLNPTKLDYASFELARDAVGFNRPELFTTVSGNLTQLKNLVSESSKISLDDLLYYKGIDETSIPSYESFYIGHASSVTNDEEVVTDMGEYISELSVFTDSIITLVADLKDFNKKDLKYLVDFE